MAKSKLVIPPRRPKTPEQQETYDHNEMITGLFMRWMGKKLIKGDEFLVLKYQDQLEQMRQNLIWRQEFEIRHYEWKCRQDTPINADDNNSI